MGERDRSPPLFTHGTQDKTTAYTHSVAMVNALKAVNRPVELFTLEGADHGFINRLNSTEGQQVFESALAYLQQNSR